MPDKIALAGTVTVIGEAIIDLVPGHEPRSFLALPGGSPYNVAIGLARLGHDTTLMARLAGNAFGRLLRDRAAAEGIRLDAAPLASEPATLAVVSLDNQARASYDFYLNGTADWHWTSEEIGRAPAATAVLHFGSIASWTPPGDEHILGLASRLRDRGDVLVSYDPNIRPGLIADHDQGQRMVERGVRLAHLVKASAEDISWLYPRRTTDEIARHWLRLGAVAVVVTDGGNGASAFRAQDPPVRRPAREVTLVDTVGAGDSFTAGLLGSLIRRDLHSPAQLASGPARQLSDAVDDAILVAALTCQRAGNDPPTAAEAAAEAAAAGPAAGASPAPG